MAKSVKINNLQKIELNILLDIDKLCKENNITYYLGEGTLLGAIRHQGFIPWDDDIDILMKREDYEKFLKLAPTNMKKKYEIQHASTIKNYWSPFIKVRYLGKTIYKQNHISHLTCNNGPLVDIFPLDNVPKEDSLGQYIQSFKIRLYRGMIGLKLEYRKPKNIKQRVVKFLSRFYTINKLHKLLDKTFKKYNNDDNEFTVNLASYYSYKKQTVANDVYGTPRYVKFEGYDLPIPNKSEFLLTKIYGNYMELPPLEKRKIKHHFDVVDVEDKNDNN